MTMQFFQPEFRIIHLNAVNEELGYIRAMSDVDDTQTLDQIGLLSFNLAAGDAESVAITEGSQFDIYDPQEGYLGRHVFKSAETLDMQGVATLRVECWSNMIELQRR